MLILANPPAFAARFIRIFFTPLLKPNKNDWKVRWLGHRRYWLFQISGWGGLLVLTMLSALAESRLPDDPDNDFVVFAVWQVLVFLMSHIIRIPILGLRMSEKPLMKVLPQLAMLVFGGATAINGAMILAYPLFVTSYQSVDEEPLWGLLGLYISFGANSALTLSAWLALYFGYHYHQSYEEAIKKQLEMNAAIKQAELKRLKAQLNPHFFFNSLNTIRSFIPAELAQPREAITLVAELIRASFTSSASTLVPLTQEIESVQNYLRLQQMRHRERLKVFFSLAPDALKMEAPPLILQTLVENAIKHGIDRLEEGGIVSVSAVSDGNRLILEVTNPRNPSRDFPKEFSTGTGLENARARLSLIYGDEAKLTLEEISETVVARVVLPQALS